MCVRYLANKADSDSDETQCNRGTIRDESSNLVHYTLNISLKMVNNIIKLLVTADHASKTQCIELGKGVFDC